MKITDIKRAVCVGDGVIGSNWTIQLIIHGLAMTLYDINDEQLKRGEAQMYKSLDALEQFNTTTSERQREIVVIIRLTTSMEKAAADAQLIQESDPERLEAEQPVLAQIETCATANTPYASSTSGLLISDITVKTAHPERRVGAHPYNPSHLIPLVELASGDKANPVLFWLAYDFYQSIGKEVILLRRERPGFITSRLRLTLYREVQGLATRGMCFVEDADRVLVHGPGLCWVIFNHNMIIQLGNPGGLIGMVNMLGDSGDRWLADTAFWTHQSDNQTEVAQPGVGEEMGHFPGHIGHTNEVCAAYRGQVFIELLELHKKL